MGNAYGMGTDGFSSDMKLAQAAKIDGFALNIASGDGNNHNYLGQAFDAADALGFKVFISFDYASGGAWSAGAVTDTINKYKGRSSHFMVNGAPFVSTFEGANNAGDWAGIKGSTGCYFVPDWSSLGPDVYGSSHRSGTDGACKSKSPFPQ